MYAGIAAGSNKAHSRIFDKKKSYLAIIHAVDNPNTKEQNPTPNNKAKVLIIYKFNFVDKRWFQLMKLIFNEENKIKKIGLKIIKIMSNEKKTQRFGVIFL